MPKRRRNRRPVPVDPELEARAQAFVRACEERVLATARMDVVRKHARLHRSGRKEVRCVPTAAELAGEAPRINQPGSDNKAIYDSLEAAEACIAELAALGSVALRPYKCSRHRTGHVGHWHLTTDGQAARRRKYAQQSASGGAS